MTTPRELVTKWATAGHPRNDGVSVEVEQEDDGGGYVVLLITTPHGEFNVTIDSEFKEPPGGMDPATGRSPEDDWLD